MSLEELYSAIFVLGSLAQLTLLAVLLVRRQYRSFPVFTTYIAFNIVSDIVLALLEVGTNTRQLAPWAGLCFLPPQYLFELGVLFELAWHVLKPVQPSLPPKAIKIYSLLMLGALAAGVLLAWHAGPQSSGVGARIRLPMDLTVGMMRMLIFVVTAGFAQALGIGWKDKILQLATGLSIYSAMDLVATLMESHGNQSALPQYLKATAYFFELVIFIRAFTTKEVRRREFSPQMREFLVTISGRARDTRAAIVRTQAK